MPVPDSDRNLLIGILALQLRFIDRDQLIGAMHEWVADKGATLDELLVNSDALNDKSRVLILELVDKHLELHGGDTQKSLDSLDTIYQSIQSDFEASQQGHPSDHATIEIAAASREDTAKGNLRAFGRDLGYPPNHGRFHILSEHAKGGLGKISVAIDQELNRKVALKQIRESLADHEESRARFILEAEVTGSLEHPGIVPVYSLGRAPDGRPFYAMRFIKGKTLKEAAGEFHEQRQANGADAFRGLEFRKLMSKFVDVCNAIEYAHSRGVLHRDLKPGNIMLGEFGETLVVDWGLSKVLSDEKADTSPENKEPASVSEQDSSITQMGSAVGTPQYMAPEQAEGRLDLLGPASDVYALGATLYYLLTDSAAFEVESIPKVLEDVREGEFRPPQEVVNSVPKPLNAICLKAMARAPEQRYDSAVQLANEIESWLADEPVMACPDSIVVKAWRFAKAHKAYVASLAAAIFVGVVSLVVVLKLTADSNRRLAKSNRKLDQTVQILDEAKKTLEKEQIALVSANRQVEQERKRVQEERDVAQAVNSFVRYDLLRRASPELEPDRTIQLRTVLDRAAAAVRNRFESQPMVEAAIAQTIGDTYIELGAFDKAESHLQRALKIREDNVGLNDILTIESASSVARLLQFQGDLQQSIEMGQQTEELCRDIYGDEHEITLAAVNNLAQSYRSAGRYREAEELLLANLDTVRRVLGETRTETYQGMMNLANVLSADSRYGEAEQILLEVLEGHKKQLGTEHPSTLATMSSLAGVQRSLGKFESAEKLLLECFATRKRVLGEEHPSTLRTMNNLAVLYETQSRLPEAEALYRSTIELRRRVLGEEHLDTIASQNNLAVVYHAQGRLDEAEGLLELAMEARRRLLGDEHKSTLQSMSNRAAIYVARGEYDKAEELLESTLNVQREVLGIDHEDTLDSMSGLAFVYAAQNRLPEAETLAKNALEGQLRILGAGHKDTLTSMNNLAGLYESMGRLDEASTLFEETLQGLRDALGSEHRYTLSTMHNLAALYEKRGRITDAETLYSEALAGSRRVLGDAHADTLVVMNNLAKVHWVQGELDDSIPLFEECYRHRKTHLGPDHEETLRTRANLGVNYRDAGRLQEAIYHLEPPTEAASRLPALNWVPTALADAYIAAGRRNDAQALLVSMIQNAARAYPPNSVELAAFQADCGTRFLRVGAYANAEEALRACIQTCDQVIPDHWQKFNSMSMLGESLSKQGEFDEASAVLLSAHEQLRRRAGQIPAPFKRCIAESALRLVEHYEAVGDQREKLQWQIAFAKLHAGRFIIWVPVHGVQPPRPTP